jgi:hypothetical protein
MQSQEGIPGVFELYFLMRLLYLRRYGFLSMRYTLLKIFSLKFILLSLHRKSSGIDRAAGGFLSGA